MVDVVASAVTRARIGEAKCLLKRNRRPIQVGAFGLGPRPRERRRENILWNKHRVLERMIGICGGRFLDEMVKAVHFVVPGTAMPMIAADEVEDARSGHIQRHIIIIGELIEKMAGVGAFVSAAAVVGAPQVSPRADALTGPAVPQAIRIETDGNHRRFYGTACCGQEERQQSQREAAPDGQVNIEQRTSNNQCRKKPSVAVNEFNVERSTLNVRRSLKYSEAHNAFGFCLIPSMAKPSPNRSQNSRSISLLPPTLSES